MTDGLFVRNHISRLTVDNPLANPLNTRCDGNYNAKRPGYFKFNPKAAVPPPQPLFSQNNLETPTPPPTPRDRFYQLMAMDRRASATWNDAEIWSPPKRCANPHEVFMSKDDISYWNRINAEYAKAKKSFQKWQIDMLRDLEAGRITKLCSLVDC